jgi:hypothetical protein
MFMNPNSQALLDVLAGSDADFFDGTRTAAGRQADGSGAGSPVLWLLATTSSSTDLGHR